MIFVFLLSDFFSWMSKTNCHLLFLQRRCTKEITGIMENNKVHFFCFWWFFLLLYIWEVGSINLMEAAGRFRQSGKSPRMEKQGFLNVSEVETVQKFRAVQISGTAVTGRRNILNRKCKSESEHLQEDQKGPQWK